MSDPPAEVLGPGDIQELEPWKLLLEHGQGPKADAGAEGELTVLLDGVPVTGDTDPLEAVTHPSPEDIPAVVRLEPFAQQARKQVLLQDRNANPVDHSGGLASFFDS